VTDPKLVVRAAGFALVAEIVGHLMKWWLERPQRKELCEALIEVGSTMCYNNSSRSFRQSRFTNQRTQSLRPTTLHNSFPRDVASYNSAARRDISIPVQRHSTNPERQCDFLSRAEFARSSNVSLPKVGRELNSKEAYFPDLESDEYVTDKGKDDPIKTKPVEQVHPWTGRVEAVYQSIESAADSVGVWRIDIWNVIHLIKPNCSKGWHWRYFGTEFLPRCPTKKAGPDKPFYCYLLESENEAFRGHTYVGFTDWPVRRLAEHNGKGSKGAKATAYGRPWRIVAVVSGFMPEGDTMAKGEALSFETDWHKRLKDCETVSFHGGRSSCRKEEQFVMLHDLLCDHPHLSVDFGTLEDQVEFYVHIFYRPMFREYNEGD